MGVHASGWWPDGEAAKILRNRGKVVPVIGAGISKSCLAPDSRALAQWLADTYPLPNGQTFSNPFNCQTVADEIADSRERSLQIRSDVADYLDLDKLGVGPNEVVRSLCRVQSRLVVTFNYDLLLEAAAALEGVDVESRTWRDHETITEIVLGDELPEKLVVFHAHGSVDDPSSIVLDRFSYADIQNDLRVEFIWRALLGRKSLCFLGVTLDEPYLIETMSSYPWTRTSHVFVSTAETVEQLSGRASITRARHGVVSESYPDHDVLRGFVQQLLIEPTAEVLSEPALPGPAALPVHSYVSNVVVPESSMGDEELALFMAPARTLTEADLALEGRVVIVGAPGSGKTQLVRQVATHVAPDEFAVLIPLSEVRIGPTSFESVLEQWTRRGEWVGRQAPANAQALRERTFHFFLDALDEVLPQEQERVARLIQELADAFPQHRFTVTSRPIAAVEAFSSDAWLKTRLLPDANWQTRYMEQRGVCWETLERQMPELADIRDLLQLPFFIAAVVDSYESGTLAESHDLWDVLSGLVTTALQREEGAGLLPLPSGPARDWLRRLALTMNLNGRASISASEAGFVTLPETLGLAGNPEDVCEALVQRALFETRGGAYVFTHRLISAALVAETLDQIEPSTELLDVIAPVRNDVVAGVREEWVVPLSFLLPRNENWRLAVEEKDPLQAARTVPLEATAEVRERAARLIWTTYEKWRIWIWNRNVPDFVEDGRRLARLLRSSDLEGLVNEIRLAARHESAQVRANAIEVLGLAGVDVEEEVAKIIRNDPDPVVRRHAFLVAERCGYIGLYEDIAERARTSDDELEVQDATLVALEMAPDSDVFALGLDLVQKESRFGALGILERRLDAGQRAQLIEKWVEIDPSPHSGARTTFEHLLEVVLKNGR